MKTIRGFRDVHEATKHKTEHVDLGKKGSFTVHKGRLHRALGIPEGQKIPAGRIQAALKSKRTFEGQSVAEMARSAKGFKAMRHGKKK